MKIIHTADWHIGKILISQDLSADHALFFDWLVDYIVSTQADVLLVSGDIFDHSNPTNDAQKTYYKAITKLQKTGVQIVLTGGNHDSAMRLNSSEDLLNLVGIDIIGGVPAQFDEQIIPLRNRAGEVKAICGAVPFLKDRDIKEFVSGESSDDRVQAIREGIYRHYTKLKERITTLHGVHLPIIAMGHLYMQGVKTTEEEREIQLGNQAGLDVTTYNAMFDYFALGHIHNPITCGENIRYSGSPIPLDFTEQQHDKIVIEITIEEGVVKNQSVKVPVFRSYRSIVGKIEELKKNMDEFENQSPLAPIYNLSILANIEDIGTAEDVIEMMRSKHFILKKKFLKTNEINVQPITSYADYRDAHDLDPKEVFLNKLLSENIPVEQYDELMVAYNDIVNMVNQVE